MYLPKFVDIHTILTPTNLQKAQEVLADNGIDADETATVMQALGFVLFSKDLGNLLDWEFENYYKEETPSK